LGEEGSHKESLYHRASKRERKKSGGREVVRAGGKLTGKKKQPGKGEGKKREMEKKLPEKRGKVKRTAQEEGDQGGTIETMFTYLAKGP